MGEEDVATEVTAGVEAMGGPDEDVTGVDAEVTAGVEAMVGPDEVGTGVDAEVTAGVEAMVVMLLEWMQLQLGAMLPE